MRPTLSLGIKFRKLRLTTKDVKKGFYKGNRTGAMGRHTKYGGYIIEWNKVRTYPVPSLEGFSPLFGLYQGNPKGPKDPEAYLERWKAENGVD
ncbi:unnamed protein product [Parascedosporium putredinis]|uniref:Uncharacterized protein n=1 Tax=Parascedosporium putredinis TaxID=1442378 RepID=A0A9P1H903_9PEZI|nr:unnamed protein product [Parascedosporium putredinis]CAI8000358.1 unnamed protein product [Parascedosporium putredinis]